MWFNSIEFLIFFVAVYSLYRLFRHKAQNMLLLLASYLFYMAWDWRFIALIVFSTIVDYFCAHLISRTHSSRVRITALFISLAVNLGALGFFKYCDFFIQSFADLMTLLHLPVNAAPLGIILPVGISFYTFQTMGYTIDVYRGELKPVRSFIDFALYVSFFPQLVAGPIERAGHLLPQIQTPRNIRFEHLSTGCALILFGLFQKVCVADNLALLVDPVYSNPSDAAGLDVVLATVAFAFQIFCDFAGYSNIARGIASLMGFDLMVNFLAPYCATNPQDFWRRWHISLSTWLRDYLYIPLGGSEGGTARTLRNLMLTMLLGGLWHGAEWNFVVWGGYIGLTLVGHRLLCDVMKGSRVDTLLQTRSGWTLRWMLFFTITCFGWMLFRVDALRDLPILLSAGSSSGILDVGRSLIILTALAVPTLLIQILQFRRKDAHAFMSLPLPARVVMYVLMFYAIDIFGVSDAQSFIYFQF